MSRFQVRVWPASPSARAIASRSVFGTPGSNNDGLGLGLAFAIKLAKPALFVTGALSEAKIVPVLTASVAATTDGVTPFSTLIVPAMTPAIAPPCRELRLITPARGVELGVGLTVGVGLGLSFAENRSSSAASGLFADEKLSVLNGWSRKA